MNSMTGRPSGLNSMSRKPRLLWVAWMVRAVVTVDTEFGIGAQPSSAS